MNQKTRSKIESVYQDVAFEKVHLLADVDPACIAIFFRHPEVGGIALPLSAVQAICLTFALLELFGESEGILDPYLNTALEEIRKMAVNKG